MARTRYLNKKSLAETLSLFVEAPAYRSPRSDEVAVEDSLGRITAEPVVARLSAPHYHGAAMDGIAVRAEDTYGASEAHPLQLQRSAKAKVEAGTFAYIDTGNALPPGANSVVMIENVYPIDGVSEADAPTSARRVEIRNSAAPWQHVRLVGEDIVATEPLLPRGHRIRPFDIGALLAAGQTRVSVAARPTVGIIPTGSELIEPGEPPRPGNVIEFNSRMIAAFITEWGGTPRRLAKVHDKQASIEAAVRRATAKHDITVVIAGSSAGEHDFTVKVLAQLGEVLVHGIDIMPGKPAICAIVDGKPVLGLPGYPVSTVIVCQQVLRPLIARLLGRAPDPVETVSAIVPRKLPSRLGLEEFMRVTLGEVGGRVIATPLGRGAGVITTMVKADGFLRIGTLSEGVNAGERVEVELLRPRGEIANTIVLSGSHDPALGVLEDALKQTDPELKISSSNTGSLGGLLALARGEAHVVGSHLLDPASGAYNLADIARHLDAREIVVVNLVIREQGLIVARRNPKRIHSLRDLTRRGIRYVNRQGGAGTRVLLDYLLAKQKIRAERIDGYEREEFTHMAVAVAIASGLADCGLGVQSAARALDLGFVPIEREEYDLVFRRDFYDSPAGEALRRAMTSAVFRDALTSLGGYHLDRNGEIKTVAIPAKRSSRRTR